MSPDVLRWVDPPDGPAVALLDQTRLPHEEAILVCRTVPELVDAIRRLAVRGAPLLGIAGAYGVALAARRGDGDVPAAARDIAEARPTAVNLALAAGRVLTAWRSGGADEALAAARRIDQEEAEASAGMAEHGMRLIEGIAARPVKILTHCNTGSLAAGGDGTAFAVVKRAYDKGMLRHLWIDETRPLLQGARLTAWEAARAGMPYAILPDGAAATLMAAGEVDLVVVGADRIARDGSVANKVGTYALALQAHAHGIPFVVVAPTSTLDPEAATGADIVVEQRDPREVTGDIAPRGAGAYNPAFDVTPPSLPTALVTERSITRPLTAGNLRSLLSRNGKGQ